VLLVMALIALTEADLELILPWRNAPAVRRAMYSHHEISLDEHRAWFQGVQQDPSRRWYLYHDAAGTPQGVVYFTDLDQAQGTAFWGFYARSEAPSGTGRQMEFEALELAFGELGLHKLNCEVLARNAPVVNMHKKVGFTEEGRFREQHLDGTDRIDVIRLSMLAKEWDEYRPSLLRRLIERAGASAEHGAVPPPQESGTS
jgi:UDP-4-amino-4,6-dideoxy-N-acetyl-beta-L-altrosamine N-acetyltransferase